MYMQVYLCMYSTLKLGPLYTLTHVLKCVSPEGQTVQHVQLKILLCKDLIQFQMQSTKTTNTGNGVHPEVQRSTFHHTKTAGHNKCG